MPLAFAVISGLLTVAIVALTLSANASSDNPQHHFPYWPTLLIGTIATIAFVMLHLHIIGR